MTDHPTTGDAASSAASREVLLYGWLASESLVAERPQDTSDAILVRTEGSEPRVDRQFRIGALDVAMVTGETVDVEPLPTARRWRGVVLGYLVDGELTVSQGGQSVTLTAGDFAFYTGAQSYRVTSPGPHRYLVVRIPTASIALRHSAFADVVATDLSRTPSAAVLRGILAALARPDSHPSISASAHLGDAVVAASHAVIADARAPGTATAMSFFNSLVIWLENNLDQDDLSAERLAAAHFVSARYVRRVFAANGTTVSGLVRQRRLERIRDDLIDPRLIRVPIRTISERWGMPDATGVSRAFSRQFGASPRRYRAHHLRQGHEGTDDWAPPIEPFPVRKGTS
ncbi:MAG: helix-turn-helix domain-containing protein [Actinomycetales bacterium]|nr:helix-turn-helix domain-containing protein [Actinomycetales bacterium]